MPNEKTPIFKNCSSDERRIFITTLSQLGMSNMTDADKIPKMIALLANAIADISAIIENDKG